ncbi:predicted protein [Sclerotinia sclerotiorum 1980 UF-70]|uniref:Uncharacterized protein n=1 Tax=Sclerotinia sclerotiorum (strain ATCC 18683 / 1980 / Ss-1) TaxID=665079 RepID=A7EPA4_SCLS1|nr:predicted protein [Sclerotinia sclerotiorum 1980 UF-70]EDO04670.1 predicted protein [Sclerotinia sclerotiorum 1980 UF-70]
MSNRDAESGDIYPKLRLTEIVRVTTIHDLQNSEELGHFLLTMSKPHPDKMVQKVIPGHFLSSVHPPLLHLP